VAPLLLYLLGMGTATGANRATDMVLLNLNP
jgi:hypothetical protein